MHLFLGTMSFNRGIKRDSFGNRNFNNRGGGGGGGGGGRIGNMEGSGGGMGGNMSGGMGGGGGGGGGGGSGGNGGMNPWEGGMMPGRGILPTPNNNLSLASPQAQLAIASNLLSNLLRSQQEVQPQVRRLYFYIYYLSFLLYYHVLHMTFCIYSRYHHFSALEITLVDQGLTFQISRTFLLGVLMIVLLGIL